MKHSAPFSKKQSFPRQYLVAGAAVLLICLLGGGIVYAILTGMTRSADWKPATVPNFGSDAPAPATTTAARLLDGVQVPSEVRAYRPWAFMIDNQVDARPAEGLAKASLVIEAPVEGGITRLLAFFDPMTPSSTAIGAVRSARPYFVEWAEGWKAVFGHVGGSPEALDKLARTPSTTVLDVNEMVRAAAYRRDSRRVAPHHVMTTVERFGGYIGSAATSTAGFSSWVYDTAAAPNASSTPAVASVRVPYGGSYTVRWMYDPAMNAYRRVQATAALSKDPLLYTNIAVIKTDASVLDEKGRLRLRTTGSGEAVIYRDGQKYIGRWRRSAGETIRFVGTDGSDMVLRAGPTWIQVTTDDLTFSGLDSTK